MLDLYNNKYDRNTLKEYIYAVKLIDILKTQIIDATFAVRYILISKYKLEKSVGRMPPLQKLIFYPSLDMESCLQLEYLCGSNNRIFSNKIIDKLQTKIFKKNRYFSSNNNAFLFDSSILHNVPLNTDESGSMRIIFNFCHISQLKLFKGREELHSQYLKRIS